MSDKSCTINPNVNDNKGEVIPSPLFKDLVDLFDGDTNKAREIWAKIDNDETRKSIDALPDDIKEYYPGTTEYSLYMYLMVSDAYKDIDEDKLKNLLLDKFGIRNNPKSDYTTLSKIKKFLDSKWSTVYSIAYDTVTKDTIVLKLVDPKKSNNKLANEVMFAYNLNNELRDVYEHLGIADSIDSITKKMRVPSNNVIYAPIQFASIFVKLLRFLDNMKASQSIPREVGYLLIEMSQNDALYNRIRNIIDDNYEKWVHKDKENPNLTEAELKDLAFCNVMAIVINRKPLYGDPHLATLVDRYLKNLSAEMRGLKSNKMNNKSFAKGFTADAFVGAIYNADNGSSTVLTTEFFQINPELRKRDENSSFIDKMQKSLEDIIKHTSRLVSIEQKIESRSGIATPRQEDSNGDDFRRDYITGFDTLNWKLIKSSSSIDNIELRSALNSHLNKCLDLIKFLKDKIAQIESVHFDETHAMNAEIAENLRDYKISVDYLEEILNVFQSLKNTEDKLTKRDRDKYESELDKYIASEKEAAINKIKNEPEEDKQRIIKEINERLEKYKKDSLKKYDDTRNSKKFFSGEVSETIKEIEGFIPTFRHSYIESLKKIISEELKDVIKDDKIVDKDGKYYTVQEFLDHATDEGIDDLGMDRWLASMAQCSNGLLSLISQYKKVRTEAANQRTKMMEQEIIRAALKLGTRDTSFMFVKDAEGHIVNRYIMDFDGDAYQEDYNAYRNSLMQRKDISEETKRNMMEDWEEEHTEVRDLLGGGRFPRRDLYKNKVFDKLSDVQKEYWTTFMGIKTTCESAFPNNMFIVDNAIVNRKNKREFLLEHKVEDNGKFKFIRSKIEGVGKIWHDTFQVTSNDIELDIVEQRDFRNRAVYSLPIYYSRLYADEKMSDMSLDTVSSLITYANILNKSAELSNVLGVLEGAADVIESFSVNKGEQSEYITSLFGDKVSAARYEQIKSRAISYFNKVNKAREDRNDIAMYRDWLRRQVYGKYQSDVAGKPMRVILNGFMKFTAIRTLGVKIGTAIANVVQARVNFIPELARKTHFTLGDAIKAVWFYYSHSGVLVDIASTHPTQKATLWSQKMNIMQDFDNNVRDLDYKKTRFGRFFNSNPMFALMHLGEHNIQHITAYSMMFNKNNELIDSEGNVYNPYTAYDKVKVDGVYELQMKSGLKANYKGSQYIVVTNEEMEQRRAQFKQDHPNEVYNEKKVLKENEISEAFWVNDFSQRVLGLNQYMHGIYNKEDSCAAQANVYCNLLLMYRRYLYPSLKRRYGARTYNAQLGEEVEGYYLTALNLMKAIKDEKNKKHLYGNLTDEQRNIVNNAFRKDDPNISDKDIQDKFNKLDVKSQRSMLFGTESARKAMIESLNEYQKGNLRVFKAEVSTLAAIMLANLAFMLFDDDDDDGFLLAELKYQLRRSQTELSSVAVVSSQISIIWAVSSILLRNFADVNIGFAGGMISETTQLINSPVVGTNVFDNVFGQNPLVDLLIIDNYTTEYAGDIEAYKGKTKAEVAARKFLPFIDIKGQVDPQKITAQKKWYGRINDTKKKKKKKITY